MDALDKQTSVNKPDKSLLSFIFLSVVMTTLLFLILLAFVVIHISLVKQMISYVELMLVTLSASTILFLILISSSIIYVYRTKHTHSSVLWLAKVGLNFLLPFTIALSEFLKCYKDSIRIFYINFNNIIVKSNIKKYSSGNVLVLLPHCMQNSLCKIKITNHIDNCQKCFKCSIGYIIEIVKNYELYSVAVATGGSSARNIVYSTKPKLIIAVACERDLANGIADVKHIPTIGILNKRPNGPCIDTCVDMEELKQVLEYVIN